MFLLAVLFVVACGQKQNEVLTHESRWQKIEAMFNEYKNNHFPEVTSITVEELKKKMNDQRFIIVDARSSEERAVSFIPTSISKEEFDKNRVQYSDASIITYCTIGYRSGIYAKKLREGKINALNLKGGVLAWAHNSNTFINEEGKTKKQIHVYGEEWALVPDEYEAVW
jgi:sodium/bile acid cotransporter 7